MSHYEEPQMQFYLASILTICKFLRFFISGGKCLNSLSPKYSALSVSIKNKINLRRCHFGK
jgi:hypothetical protein